MVDAGGIMSKDSKRLRRIAARWQGPSFKIWAANVAGDANAEPALLRWCKRKGIEPITF